MTVSGLASQCVAKNVSTLDAIEAPSENVLTSEAIEASRSFFRGRRQWPQASQSADPGGQGGVWGLQEVRVEGSALFEGYRGAGAVAVLVSQSVLAGLPISVTRRKWKIHVFLK